MNAPAQVTEKKKAPRARGLLHFPPSIAGLAPKVESHRDAARDSYMTSKVLLLLLAAVLAIASAAAGAALPPDVLAKNRWVQLTRADYDAALARVPEKSRFDFATSPKRVQDLLNTLLLTKTLAAQARAHGTRPQTSFAGGESAAPDAERALADAELARVEADANKAFDAAKASYEARARYARTSA